MEIYKWKWMVSDALSRMNNVDFEKKVVKDILNFVSEFSVLKVLKTASKCVIYCY